MPADPLQPGDPRVLGTFQLLARLGEGGQGIVYEGRGASGERVAIKILKGGADPETRRRLTRELESARRVAPFCTARVLGAEPDQPTPYVVSEFVAGPSLQERVRAQGPLRHGDLDRLAVGTACALAAIHAAGVVHRDFKPANVLLGPDGPRVVDFGIARPLDASTAPSVLSGTPPYMAPEQLRGEHGSPAADVFAWASTMVYAATGRAPFGSDTVAAVFNRILTQEPDLSGIPDSLRGTLAACLSKDPRTRPSARSLLIGLVDPGDRTVTVPDVGPVPSVYVPPDWPGSTRVLPPEPGLRTAPLPVDGSTAPYGERITRRLRPAVALIAVAALATAAVLYLRGTNDGPTTQAAPDTSSGPSAERTPAAESTPEQPPAKAGAIPPDFAGVWKGQVVSQDNHNESVDVTISLAAGQSTGTWTDDDCVLRATLTRVRSDAELEMSLAQQGTCVGGDMTLALAGPGTLNLVRQEGAGSLEYRGSLRHS
ncbi:serine/threonine-protein kinase [Nonomuraea insulae]|uniref:Serine/threonine-protein kinase n=1 Tax=Nonomuraea insulae TaxID=1616787 RepID=A0ABW1D8P2_9ACTN